MVTSFITNAAQPLMAISSNDSKEVFPGREEVKLLLIGSSKGVNSIIRQLFILGFAEVSEWSSLQPTGNKGEVMSILFKHIVTQ